jgi:iron complex transport system ATP-binding protein
VIELHDVAVSFGDVSVLDGVDLRVDRGEFVGLVGPNGAGKTTLLRTVNGVLEPDNGEVWLDDDRVAGLHSREISRRLASVPQDTHLGFAFTVEQVVEMGRTPHRSRLDWSDGSGAVEAALERTGTAEFRDRRIDDVSGGERQRVLLARALAGEPEGLLLDEPTASLDVNHQLRVLGLVEEFVAGGHAAIAAIHDLDLAARFCDRLAVLSGGAIRARGSPAAVLRDPRLGEAFETTAAVTQDPVTGTPTVAAVPDRADRPEHVHVAGGGEGAVAAVRALWRAGFAVSIGPVPEGDVAASLATQLDLETVTAPAFEPPDAATARDAAALASAADAVVVTDGPGGDVLADPGDEGLDGPGGDALDGSDADHTDRVHAALAGRTGQQTARGDGGRSTVVETESDLLTAVGAIVDGNPD